MCCFGAQGGSITLDEELESGAILLSADFAVGQYVKVEESADLLEWDLSRLLLMDESPELQTVYTHTEQRRFFRAQAADEIGDLLNGNEIYVDSGVTASGDGASWGSAFKTLAEAFGAAANGDVVFSRGTFYESLVIRDLDDFAWIGDSDEALRTIIRGDEQMNDVTLDILSEVNGAFFDSATKPRTVTWNYRRDDSLGTVTGIEGLRPYYGHLIEVESPAQVRMTQGSWGWDDGVVYISPPEGDAYVESQISMCLGGRDAIEIIDCSNFLVSGLDVALWMGFSSNTGYAIQGIACLNGVIEDVHCWDYGWHAIGFSGSTSYNCEIRNCHAYSPAELGGALQNPYVFYASGFEPNLGHRIIGSSFHVYPSLTVNGDALYGEMKPKMLLVHGDSGRGFLVGGVVMKDCHMKSWLHVVAQTDGSAVVSDSLQGTTVVSLDDSVEYDWDRPWEYPLQVIDSVFESEMLVPGNNVAFWRCRFDGTGYTDSRGFTSQHRVLISYCVSSEFIYPKFEFGAHQYIRQHRTNPGVFYVTFEHCLFAIGGNNSRESAMFGVFKPSDFYLRVRNSIFHSGEAALLLRSYASSSVLFTEASLDFKGNWYDLHGSRAFRTSNKIGSYFDWESDLDLPLNGARYQAALSFTSPASSDFSYDLGSALDLLTAPKSNLADAFLKGINQANYSGSYGPHQ